MRHPFSGSPSLLSAIMLAGSAALGHGVDGAVANDCVVFRLTPVHPPPTAAPYPPGTIVDTDNNTIILPGGVDQWVWFEVRISNWGCVGPLHTWQAMVGHDAVLPPGIFGVYPPCEQTLDCVNLGFGPLDHDPKFGTPGAECREDESSCVPCWEDRGRSDWLSFEIAACNGFTRTCGGTLINAPATMDDGLEHYAMSVVLGIDASFVGTVEIPFQVGDGYDTFVVINDDVRAPGKAIPATVIVPTGACCFGVGSASSGCSDGLTFSECEALPGPAHDFHADQACGQIECPQQGACCDTLEGACIDLVLENECIDRLDQWSPGLPCAEVECVSSIIPTVSEWGLVVLTLGLLAIAKAQSARQERWGRL